MAQRLRSQTDGGRSENPIQDRYGEIFNHPISTIHPPVEEDVEPEDDVDDDFEESDQEGARDSAEQLSRQEQGADRETNTKEANARNKEGNDSPVRQQEQNSSGAWQNNVSQKDSNNKSHAKSIPRFYKVKKFGPAGLVGTLLIGGISGLTFTTGPASLLINLKENFVQNHDQQSVTGEIRGRKLLNKRLASKTTSGFCKIKLACRYQKPSDRLLKRLNAEGIKALDANGAEIEKQGFLSGKTRPAQFQLKDGKKVAASDFMKTLRDDPEFRRAFRRAHSPRWMNWFDDVAIKFLKKHGIAKSVPDGIKNAKKPDELNKAKEKAPH